MRRLMLVAIITAFTQALAGCDQRGSIVTLKQAPRITSAAGVQVYTAMPPGAEVLGMIEARSIAGWTYQQHMDSAVSSLKSLAADAGANGVVLQQLGSTEGGTIITGGASAGAPMLAIPTGGYPVLRGTAILVRSTALAAPSRADPALAIDQRLAALKDLHARNLITTVEYEAKRKAILGGL